jgi:hypothetical protein
VRSGPPPARPGALLLSASVNVGMCWLSDSTAPDGAVCREAFQAHYYLYGLLCPLYMTAHPVWQIA